MKQPWIHKKTTDLLFILLPPFGIALIVLLFHKELSIIQSSYSFLSWMILIVFIDVAHVYATLFKTYFNKTEFTKNRRLFLQIPAICLLLSTGAFFMGAPFFWSALAYIAVFHFIRQQYGFMRLYSRNEVKTFKKQIFDKVVIYNATLFPMLYWFLNPDRHFNWFIKNEFLQINAPEITQILFVLFLIILGVYLIQLLYEFITTGKINLPKTLLILGTYVSWYLSIVHYNNELIFTFFNVVSHGVPYMALIYFREIKPKKQKLYLLRMFFGKKMLPAFLLIILVFAIIEEFIWELTVWEEHIQIAQSFFVPESFHFIWIPFLALPQLTHYVLDGFIWKSK